MNAVGANVIALDDVRRRADFDRLWPYLRAALERVAFKHNGRVWVSHRKEHVWERIASGKAFLWPGKESAIITEFYVTPTGLKSHHTWLAGGKLEEIVAMMPTIEDWGRKNGCHRQTGSGRAGWLKVFDGYHAIGVRKEKSLIIEPTDD